MKPLVREQRKQLHSNFVESEWFDNIVLHELDVLGDDPDFLKVLLKNFEREGLQHVLNIKKHPKN